MLGQGKQAQSLALSPAYRSDFRKGSGVNPVQDGVFHGRRPRTEWPASPPLFAANARAQPSDHPARRNAPSPFPIRKNIGQAGAQIGGAARHKIARRARWRCAPSSFSRESISALRMRSPCFRADPIEERRSATKARSWTWPRYCPIVFSSSFSSLKTAGASGRKIRS